MQQYMCEKENKTMSNVFCLICNINVDVSFCVNIFYTYLPHNGQLLGSFLSRTLRVTASDLRGSHVCSHCYNLFQMLDQAQRTVANIRCEILKIYRSSERKESIKQALDNGTDLNVDTNPVFIQCKPDVNVQNEQSGLNPLRVQETIDRKCTQNKIIDQNLTIPSIISGIGEVTENSKNCKRRINEYNKVDSTKPFDYTDTRSYIRNDESSKDIINDLTVLNNDSNVRTTTTTTLQEEKIHCSQRFKEVEEKVTNAKENFEIPAGKTLHTGTEIDQLQRPLELGKISKYHLKPLKHSCPTCGKKFRTPAELRAHVNSHSTLRPYMCEKCGKAYKHKYALETHVGMHNGINPFQCNICKKCFTQKGALMRHLPIHTGEMPYQCELCGKRFKHHTSYNIHKLTHSEEKSYKCPTCDVTLRSSSHVKRHLRVHTGEKPYSCASCGKRFAQRYNLLVHQKIHDLSENKTTKPKRVQYK